MFPNLFSPLALGPVTIRNRVVSSGHDTILVDSGVVNDALIAYHVARADGGVGLIVTQVADVDPEERSGGGVLQAWNEDCVSGYARLADQLHARGTTVFAQLHHGGRETHRLPDGTLPVTVAPSAVPNERFLAAPRALDAPRIRRIVVAFGDAADRMRRAGLDGVEVVASHGYLPAQFLNPHTNRRDDDYGGSPQRRLRFLRDVLVATRTGAGPGLAVGLRISIDDESFDGLAPDAALEAIAALDADGLVDYLSVVSGSSSSYAGSHHIVPSMHHPAAYVAPRAAEAKRRVSVPVMVAGRINQPQEAEAIIAAGQADATVMTRALICDPFMPAKAAAGRAEDIRACIACNQACIGHYLMGTPISCIQHPETGRELTYGVVTRAATSRRVLVVGGGPGGLKAAAVAAQRGHRVVLHEAAARVGGQALRAEKVPGRAEFGGIVTNLEHEARSAGVEIRTRSTMTVETIAAERPDVVVVATGARPRRPDLAVEGELAVLDAWQVLDGADLPSGRLVVADWRGDWIGLGTAIALAQRGRRVTLAANGPHAGQSLMQYVRDEMTAEALRRGVTIVPFVRPYGVDDDTVYLQHVLTAEPVLLEAAALVLATGHDPVDELLRELEARRDDGRLGDLEVHAVGDCLSPRTAEEAVLDALQVASAL
jgi:2,4-dienoyl-CoA reductase-like NADH-dependent reductase (Old Yellow Enzyme family)/thioredoxin reductase